MLLWEKFNKLSFLTISRSISSYLNGGLLETISVNFVIQSKPKYKGKNINKKYKSYDPKKH